MKNANFLFIFLKILTINFIFNSTKIESYEYRLCNV